MQISEVNCSELRMMTTPPPSITECQEKLLQIHRWLWERSLLCRYIIRISTYYMSNSTHHPSANVILESLNMDRMEAFDD